MTTQKKTVSSTVDYIKGPIQKELDLFEKKFRESMSSKVALLDTIMNYIVKRKGKQMRPIMVLHCAKLFGEINDKTYRGAALVELLHTATLVHDDVVDDANMRRGFFSINALWKNKIAVLVGDYLLSKGLLLSLKNKDYYSLEILSTAVEEMSEGELLQMEKARKLDITEEVYFNIITKKTASLLAACCGIGAASVQQNEDVVKQMEAFGLSLGIAFQIKDDIFDYGDNKIGKPTGIDIIEKKMTLPLIYALKNSDQKKAKEIFSLMKKSMKKRKDVNYVIEFVLQNNGLEYARQQMLEYKHKALDILNNIPTTNGNKEFLITLANYVVDRKK